ncbi:helix-turn-helix transcriptional regulator [Micromonospora sp. WMMD1102]|uniref:helix-turn-helix domain-containing protein n=1 Tax=Micromonospora sp. WMMD1102 TaxID=3016105 RepID=UPI002414FA5F|nr:helix-turn-helix transcriptional regulator [Micromonospora sp. WMMD1102]MDG4789883.1 helix-turn-helix transcriptional regulator [Micromonospora sp. WMMD1102]
MTDSGSSVPRRQLGRHLCIAREQAGLGLEAASQELEVSRTTMYRIESGGTSVRKADVLAMCTTYGVSNEMTEALIGLATQTKAAGWWHSYGDAIPSWFELYVGLEAAASRLRHWEPASFPGLLQTREYATHLLRSQPDLPESEIERRVEVRMERQQILLRRKPAPPRLEVILDEVVLRRRTPGMARQLTHLHSMMTSSETTDIRVLPLATQPNWAVAGSNFVILDFPPTGLRTPEPTTIYSESLTGATDGPAAGGVSWRPPPGVANLDHPGVVCQQLPSGGHRLVDPLAVLDRCHDGSSQHPEHHCGGGSGIDWCGGSRHHTEREPDGTDQAGDKCQERCHQGGPERNDAPRQDRPVYSGSFPPSA